MRDPGPGSSPTMTNPVVSRDKVLRLLASEGGATALGVYAASEVAALVSVFAQLPMNDAVRQRGGAVYASRNVLDLCPSLVSAWRTRRLVEIVTSVLGPEAGLVRGLFFDKPPEQTWALPWHKDLTIAVGDSRDVPGYSKPRLRAGVWHCEPPQAVLEAMLTLRIHLDDVTEENGPLQVLPGSHQTGKQLRIDRFEPRRILVQAGDVFLMRPLLAHCSGRSAPETRRHRRVLHLEFSAMPTLPGGQKWHTFHPVNNA